MIDMTIAIEHEGRTYYGQLGVIESTMFGAEDHGITTASLAVKWKGGGVSVGGYGLDIYDDETKSRVGAAYGMDQLIRIMETVGVTRWESLKGKSVIALFGDKTYLGSRVLGIAGLHTGKVLILEEHAAKWRGPDGLIS